MNEITEELILQALSWYHDTDDASLISRKRKQLRETDIQDLIWEYEDANGY